MHKKTMTFLDSAPALWNAIATGNDHLKAGDWQQIDRDLSAIAQQAAMLGAYLADRKGTDGSGEGSHVQAVKKANRQLVKVRRALGFNVPEAGKLNF